MNIEREAFSKRDAPAISPIAHIVTKTNKTDWYIFIAKAPYLIQSLLVYGVEGFIDTAPEVMDALQQINALSDADIAERMNNPYRYE